MRNYTGGVQANYRDLELLVAIEHFIVAFGSQYDGDPRIAFIQAGLIGCWGEWNAYGTDFLPDYVKVLVTGWYALWYQIHRLEATNPLYSNLLI
jgi:hypothetical protein